MGNLLVTRARGWVGGHSCLLKRGGKRKKKKHKAPRGMKERQKSVSCWSQLGEPFWSVNTLAWVWRNELKRARTCPLFCFKQRRGRGRYREGSARSKKSTEGVLANALPVRGTTISFLSRPLPQAFSQSFPAQAKLPSIFITSAAPALNLLWGY